MKRLDIRDIFAGCRVHINEDFYRDFFAFADRSAEQDYVKKKTVQLLMQLSETPVQILCKGGSFEKLSDYRDLYLIRIETMTLNLRMLFIAEEDGQAYLVAFEEYAGKFASNYEKYSPLAVKRTRPFRKGAGK